MPRTKRTPAPPSRFSPEMLDDILKTHNTQEAIFGSNGIVKDLIRALAERALQTELSHHLGYQKHASDGKNSGNSRNGASPKTLRTEQGELELKIPRDRNGTFEPLLVPKHARRLPGFDEKVLSLFLAGLTEGQIRNEVVDLYGTDVSLELISEVTDALLDELDAWQNRPLERLYCVVWVDALVVKIRHQHVVQNRTVYVALGLKPDGHKELLGMWVDSAEGAKFWLNVLNQLRQRGVQDILIGCMDGLKGFPEAWRATFPKAVVQTCVVHLVRNTLELVSWKERKEMAADLRKIYTATTEEQALRGLDAFEERWKRYPTLGQMWRRRWEEVRPFLAYPEEIRKVIYTTNAIESVNSQFRRSVQNRGHFPTERSALKVLYVTVKQMEKKWTKPVHNWGYMFQQFVIHFPDRMPV